MKNKTFTTLGVLAISVGAFALGSAAWAIYKRKKDEESIQDATAEAAALNENFSGAAGRGFARRSKYVVGFNKRGVPVLINRPKMPEGGDTSRKKGPYYQCYEPYKLVNGWCVKEQKETASVAR